MEEKLCETLVFSLNSYLNKENITREQARDLMWYDIMQFLKILMAQDQVAVIRDDDIDIIVVEYEHNERIDAWGCPGPHWICEDEYNKFLFYQQASSEDNNTLEYYD